MHKWRKNFIEDTSYRPGQSFGKHRMNFTSVQEKAVAEFLRIQYLLSGVIVKRKNLRDLIFDCWKSFDLPNRRQCSENPLSQHFETDFCRRNRFSFRKMRCKKRTNLNPEEVARFTIELRDVMMSYDFSNILNMDETS